MADGEDVKVKVEEKKDFAFEVVIRKCQSRIVGAPPPPPDEFEWEVRTNPPGGGVPLAWIEMALASVQKQLAEKNLASYVDTLRREEMRRAGRSLQQNQVDLKRILQ